MSSGHHRAKAHAAGRIIMIPFSIDLSSGAAQLLTLKPDAAGEGAIPERFVLDDNTATLKNWNVGGTNLMKKGVAIKMSVIENGMYAGQGYWFRRESRSQAPSFNDEAPFTVELTKGTNNTVTGVLFVTPAVK